MIDFSHMPHFDHVNCRCSLGPKGGTVPMEIWCCNYRKTGCTKLRVKCFGFDHDKAAEFLKNPPPGMEPVGKVWNCMG